MDKDAIKPTTGKRMPNFLFRFGLNFSGIRSFLLQPKILVADRLCMRLIMEYMAACRDEEIKLLWDIERNLNNIRL